MRGLPVRMVVHMGCYFVVFGLTHSISSEIVSATQAKLLSGHVGLMAAAILFWVALTVTGTDRIWHKVRGAVFPLAMLGFILLPSALRNSHALSVLLAECASYLYYLIALFAAVKAARLGIAPIGRTFATVCMLGGAFYAVGISCGTAARLMGPFDEATYSVLTACVFVLLTVGTFWVGDDKTADMFWGLEKKLSPKAYNEQQTRLRCAAVASRYGLTRRESEILAPLALGTSPDAIGREQTVSIATVRSHIHNIYVKLGVHTHAELIELVERTPLDQGER